METNAKIEEYKEHALVREEQKEAEKIHYHGDVLRIIFIVMAVMLLVLTPFVKDELDISVYLAVFGIVLLSTLAGFLRPGYRVVIWVAFLSSLTALVLFGYELIMSYGTSHSGLFTFGNLVLSLLALVAVYNSGKTVRGSLVN